MTDDPAELWREHYSNSLDLIHNGWADDVGQTEALLAVSAAIMALRETLRTS